MPPVSSPMAQQNIPRLLPAALAVALACAPALLADDFQGSTHKIAFDEEVINYNQRQPHGAIERLQQKIDKGEVKLKYDPKFGYLPAVLDALRVPKSSQMLVFSRTSLQRAFISPKNPRSIFYNDDVYVGFTPGAPLM